MYCRTCGKEIHDNAVICPHCGCATGNPMQGMPGAPKPKIDSGSVGWAFLGFFIPFIGLLLYLIWKDDKPLSAKMAGKGALIFLIVTCAITLLEIIIVILGATVTSCYYY